MKKIFIFILLCLVGIAFFTPKAFAVLPMPFGGRVVSSGIPGIVCPGTGPASILPYNVAPPTPYYIAPGIPSGYGLFPVGSYVLGAYYSSMVPICVLADGAPFPVFPVIMYGISSPTL